MRLRTALACLAGIGGMMGAAMPVNVLAGQWKQDSVGWWYQNDDGSYPISQWMWIGGNGDGEELCYYFDGNGYMLSNTTTPDGNQVGADGAWTINGKAFFVAQTRQADAVPA